MKAIQFESRSNNESFNIVRSFIMSHRCDGRLLLTTEQLHDLSSLLQKYMCLDIDFFRRMPLSIMERLVLGLRLVTKSYSEREYILGVPKGTMQGYEKRAKQKLGADSIMQAICIGIQNNTCKVI